MFNKFQRTFFGRFIILVALFLGTIRTQAKSDSHQFVMNHSDCMIRVKKELPKLALSLLKERNFTPHQLIRDKNVLPNDLYFNFIEEQLETNIYRPCKVTVELYQAKGRTPSKTDIKKYHKEVIRRVPRITFKGHERCRLAAKEAFIHIPYCKKTGHASEK